MTPTDLDEDDRTAERADAAILHDITPAPAAPWDWPPNLCRYHCLPYVRGTCTACAQERDEIDRYDANHVWHHQRNHP